MNIARTLCFKQELKEKSVLLDLDPVQTVLIAESSAYVLSFNPSIAERTDKLCIDIQNVVHSKSTCWSDQESDEDLKSFCLEEKFELFYDCGIKSVKGYHIKEFKRSLLAMLGSRSSLIVFIDNFQDPDEAFDFHSIMRNEVDKSSHAPLHSLNSEKVRRRMFDNLFSSKLNVLCMCWSQSVMNVPSDGTSSSSVYFGVSHFSGFITIWEVNVLNARFDLVCGVDVGDVTVEEMFFFICGKSTNLCMSFRDGRVCLVEFLPSESGSSVLDVTYIWDEKDNIPTNGIVYVEHLQMLAIPKNQHLILLNFDFSDEKKKSFTLQFLLVDTRFYISSVVPFLSELVLVTFDGSMYKVMLTGDKKLQTEQMLLPWNTKDWNIFGTRTTKNNVYLIMATYPSNFYCNRIVKQPSLVHFIPITTLEDIGQLVINHLGPVYEIFDALCHLKFELAHGGCWPHSLIDYMNDVEDLDSLPLQKLKVFRCILSIRLLYLKEEDKDFKERLAYCIKKTEILILMNHIQATFGMLYSLNFESLLPMEKSSLTVMKSFMLKNAMNSNFVLLEMFSYEFKEVCPVCSSAVRLDDHTKGSCSNGHVFARCCQSLLLCTDIPYRTCVVCKSSAVQKLDECSLFGNILNDTCTCCDGQLKLIEGY